MRAILAAMMVTVTQTAQAQALFVADVLPPAWPESMGVTLGGVSLGGIALGAGAVLPLALSVIAWQRWSLYRLRRRIDEKEAETIRLAESLMSAPDGFYAWMPPGREICSRRLAVLLGLGRGIDSSFDDVTTAFAAEDSARLNAAVAELRREGANFELDLALADGGRRVGIHGIRAAAADGETLADLLWVRDVTEGAAVIDGLAHQLDDMARDSAYVRGLLDALSAPIWLRDDDLSLLAVNQAYADAVDADSPAAVIAGQIELASDGLVREARALAARARAAGEPRSESFHLVLGGQRRLTAITEASFPMGDRLLTAGSALDQTRTEELQIQLDHHIAAHGEVLERLATAIAIFSTDTRLTFFNTAFVRLWRLDGEWLAAQPTYGGIMDALRERRLLPEVADYRAYKDEELRRFISLIDPAETLLHLPDGRTLRRLISAHPYGGLIFTYEDVTDSLALERSFNTMMAVQRETLDHLHEGLAVFGDDGRLKLSNPAFARLWRLEPSALAGEPHVAEVVERLQPFFDRSADWTLVRARLLALFAERAPAEGRLERNDDSILDWAAVPLPDGALLLAWLDVTDTARVERALRERNEALAAADLLKSEFITNVSAEVRKPLTSVIGFSEMLTAEYFGPLTPRQQEYTQGITSAGRALQTLIADILDLAAIEAGRLTLELDAVEIHPLLASVLSLVRERVREKKLTLTFECPLDIGWIVADQRRLRQVMFNLIGNAVKFTPSGGAVTVSANRDQDQLVLQVADTGPGIPSTAQAALFEGFVHGPQPEGHAGAGLGLALVKRFVVLHGGRVGLRSAPGEGTVITVLLPAAPGEAGAG
jgi:signal transduction histidine kinase